MSSGQLKTMPVGDIGGEFFIPSYQRGYRWGEQEVCQLLADIRNSEGATYYLQPVVVKARDDGSWELVDGQQRLTTLYLIFRYLQRSHLPSISTRYALTYETREGSKEYLELLDEDASHTNIDYFHMFNAYACIESWFAQFEHRTTHEATRFYSYLFESVKVLWYEAPDEVDSRDLFTRLNVGRIPLTDAELVKAQLLSHGRDGLGGTDRALEIAAHWDLIERDLRDPELWAFLTGQADEEPTHIGLLLDTIAGGERGRRRPLFHTFEMLRARIADDAHAFWREVVDLHSLVLGWYDDRDLYHKVGYLIAVGRTFGDLVALSRDRGRSDFESALDSEIRRHLSLSGAELLELSYESYRRTTEVLLLMNIETIRGMKNSSERYSFKAHAAGDWSLEHIHAQNADPLKTAEQWEAWLSFHRGVLADLPGIDEQLRHDLLERIETALAGKLTKQVFSALERELTAILSDGQQSDDYLTHSITNLALLDHDANAALNNSVFEVKRRMILKLDKDGTFIPACTRNIFLKYYTTSSRQQHFFWSSADRDAYLAAIIDAVCPYFTEEEMPS